MASVSKKHGKHRHVSANTVTKSRQRTGLPSTVSRRAALEYKSAGK